MKKIVSLIFICFVFFWTSLLAKPLPPEIVLPIQIMDLIIKGNQYDKSKCGDYVCELVSQDSTSTLRLTRASLKESRNTDVDFRFEIKLKGSIVDTDLIIEYLHDPEVIRFISSADGEYYPNKGTDPIIFKVLVSWLDWMLEDR